MLREQNWAIPFPPWFQIWEPQLVSAGSEGVLRAVCVFLNAVLTRVAIAPTLMSPVTGEI